MTRWEENGFYDQVADLDDNVHLVMTGDTGAGWVTLVYQVRDAGAVSVKPGEEPELLIVEGRLLFKTFVFDAGDALEFHNDLVEKIRFGMFDPNEADEPFEDTPDPEDDGVMDSDDDSLPF